MGRRVWSAAARAGLGAWANSARGVGRGAVLEGVDVAQAGGQGQWSWRWARGLGRARAEGATAGGIVVVDDLWALWPERRCRQGSHQPGASSGSRAGLEARRARGVRALGAGWTRPGTRAVVLRKARRACDATRTPRDFDDAAGLCCSGANNRSAVSEC